MPKKSSTLFSRSYLDRNDYSFTVKLSPELSVNIFSAVLHAPHHVLSALSPSPRHTKGAHLPCRPYKMQFYIFPPNYYTLYKQKIYKYSLKLTILIQPWLQTENEIEMYKYLV